MKITREDSFSIRGAVEYSATCNAYDYSGQLEKLSRENEKLRELVARLVESIYCGEKIAMSNTDRLEYILDYGFEVEP